MNRKLTILLVFCLLVLPGTAFARVYDVKLSGAAALKIYIRYNEVV